MGRPRGHDERLTDDPGEDSVPSPDGLTFVSLRPQQAEPRSPQSNKGAADAELEARAIPAVVTSIRSTEINADDSLGIVFEPEEGSDQFVVMLSGSSGGFPEAPAKRLAENGFTSFALGYHGAPGLPPALIEVKVELLQAGIELFRDRYAGGRSVGLVGMSKGAELALVLAAELGDAIGPVVAVAPSHVVWFGLKASGSELLDRRSDQSSWSWKGAPLPFLQCPTDIEPAFNERGLRTDVFFDLSRFSDEAVDRARIRVERSTGPILLLSGDDDHQWPAASMAAEIVERMAQHGRAAEVTSVVYPQAGHTFLVTDFMSALGSKNYPPFDFGGSREADAVASQDAWRRTVSFLHATKVGTGEH